MFVRSLTSSLAVLGVAMALTACGGAAISSNPSGGDGGAPSGGSLPATSAEPNAPGGPDGFEGTLTSSGVYSATWTVATGLAADPFNSSSHVTLTSDKNTFGNIRVQTDGSLSFGSGATELSQNGAYTGTGATVTLDSTGQFVCAFSVDTDLKGSNDGAILRLSGNMIVRWHPLGIGGDLSCP